MNFKPALFWIIFLTYLNPLTAMEYKKTNLFEHSLIIEDNDDKYNLYKISQEDLKKTEKYLKKKINNKRAFIATMSAISVVGVCTIHVPFFMAFPKATRLWLATLLTMEYQKDSSLKNEKIVKERTEFGDSDLIYLPRLLFAVNLYRKMQKIYNKEHKKNVLCKKILNDRYCHWILADEYGEERFNNRKIMDMKTTIFDFIKGTLKTYEKMVKKYPNIDPLIDEQTFQLIKEENQEIPHLF